MRSVAGLVLVPVGFLLTVAACSDGHKVAPDGEIDDGDGMPNEVRTVTGTFVYHNITAAGVDTPLVPNLTTATVAIFVPETGQMLTAHGTSQGTFSVPNVPKGTYFLSTGRSWFVRDTDSIDLSIWVPGRADATFAETSPTNLAIDATNLAAWQASDTIELMSPSAPTLAYIGAMDASSGAPTPGATTLAGFTYDLAHADLNGLPTAVANDHLTVTQLATKTGDGRTYRAAARSFAPTAFTIANGGSASISGAFAVPATAGSLSFAWDRGAVDTEIRAHSPGAAADTASIAALKVLPDAALYGYYVDAPDLVVFDPGYATDHTTLTANAWTYADPYPAAWTRWLSVEYYSYQFVGDVVRFASILQEVPLADLAAGPIRPTIGLVANVQINGLDAFTQQANIGDRPTVSWSAPSIGTAGLYIVDVMRVPASNMGNLSSIASFRTTSTSLKLPPGVIATGGTYAFMITALADNGLDPVGAPGRLAIPQCRTRVTTAFATP